MAKMTGGYIRLYRDILTKDIYKNPSTRNLFIHILLTANIKESTYMGVKIPVGARVASFRGLAKETGLSVKEVRAQLMALVKAQTLAHTPTPKFSVITVINWSEYQQQGTVKGTEKGTQKGNRMNKISRNDTDNKEREGCPSDEELDYWRKHM